MIGRWIVKVDSALGQAQAEDLGVKIHVTLRIARDGSDMMNPEEFHNQPKANKFPTTYSTHVFVATTGKREVVEG